MSKFKHKTTRFKYFDVDITATNFIVAVTFDKGYVWLNGATEIDDGASLHRSA